MITKGKITDIIHDQGEYIFIVRRIGYAAQPVIVSRSYYQQLREDYQGLIGRNIQFDDKTGLIHIITLATSQIPA